MFCTLDKNFVLLFSPPDASAQRMIILLGTAIMQTPDDIIYQAKHPRLVLIKNQLCVLQMIVEPLDRVLKKRLMITSLL